MSTAMLEAPTAETTRPERFELRIDHDPDVANPSEWGGWKLIPFGSKYANSEDKWDYFDLVPGTRNEVYAKSIGLRRRLDTGTAFIVSLYSHSGESWTLMHEGVQDGWDSTNVAGLLLWQRKPNDAGKTYEKRRESARAFMEIYTDWANGATYWYSLTGQDGDGEEIDTGSDYIGEEDIVETIGQTLQREGITRVRACGEGVWMLEYHSLGEGITVLQSDNPDDDDED